MCAFGCTEQEGYEDYKMDIIMDDEKGDVLSVTVDEYTVTQTKKGELLALRHGEIWRDCVGDNLILALAQEVERLREKLELTDSSETKPLSFEAMQRVKIICGGTNTGKTTLAKQLCEGTSNYAVVPLRELKTPFGLGDVLSSGVKTLIVDVDNFTEIGLDYLKTTVTEDKVTVNIKGKPTEVFDMPNFIFCTGPKDTIPHWLTASKLFTVIEVSRCQE